MCCISYNSQLVNVNSICALTLNINIFQNFTLYGNKCKNFANNGTEGRLTFGYLIVSLRKMFCNLLIKYAASWHSIK